MTNPLPENLKFLRKSKGMTQQDLATALFLNRPVIGAYEEGRAEPKLETLKKISELFAVSLEHLIGISLEENSSQDPNLARNETPTPAIIPLKILSITVDSDQKENIEWVPIKASAGYLNGFRDPDYMASLPKFQLPMLKGGTLRAFEIKGDSMLPLVSGTFIIGEFIEDWRFIKDGETYVVISKNEGIVYKRLYRMEKDQRIKLVSDNPEFEAYTLELQDLLEIWKAKAFISTRFPQMNPQSSIEKIGDMLVELQKSMNQLKNS